MSDDTGSKNEHLPALTQQVSELVLAGSLDHAEEAFSKAADEHGDYAVARGAGRPAAASDGAAPGRL